jgi:dephospho-CoA kinase
MIIIGLCGGSGSGKGTVAQILECYGIPNINADEVYRYLTKAGGALIPALSKEFGSSVISSDGALDRRQLSSIVFTSDGHEEKLRRLNEITHAAILAETEKRILELEKSGKNFVVFDAPLLFESGFNAKCDMIVAVTADTRTRVERIVKRDSITAKMAKERISTQLSDEFLKENSDYVIVNNGELCELDRQVKELAEKIFTRG